jgi:hypothetical protein
MSDLPRVMISFFENRQCFEFGMYGIIHTYVADADHPGYRTGRICLFVRIGTSTTYEYVLTVPGTGTGTQVSSQCKYLYNTRIYLMFSGFLFRMPDIHWKEGRKGRSPDGR